MTRRQEEGERERERGGEKKTRRWGEGEIKRQREREKQGDKERQRFVEFLFMLLVISTLFITLVPLFYFAFT
ncbi:MAG: hypothetical protein WC155_09810 [Candidatus Cloacimonadales bacterium]